MDNEFEMNEKEWEESEKKLNDLEQRLHEVVLRYAYRSSLDQKAFHGELARIVEALSSCLVHVIVAGVNTEKMDKEKFVLYMDELTRAMKRDAQEKFDYLASHDEGPKDI